MSNLASASGGVSATPWADASNCAEFHYSAPTPSSGSFDTGIWQIDAGLPIFAAVTTRKTYTGTKTIPCYFQAELSSHPPYWGLHFPIAVSVGLQSGATNAKAETGFHTDVMILSKEISLPEEEDGASETVGMSPVWGSGDTITINVVVKLSVNSGRQ